MVTKRRLREALTDEKARTEQLRRRLGDMTEECESWRSNAKSAMGSHEDVLIRRTHERDEARRTLRATEDQLGAARRENAVRTGRMLAYSNQAVDNMRRLARTLRACARYRAQIAGQRQEIRQLTDSLGYLPVDRARLDTPINIPIQEAHS